MQEKRVYTETNRLYRSNTSVQENEQQIQLVIEESDLLITLTNAISKKEILPFIQKELLSLRHELKAYTQFYPEFQSSLTSLDKNTHTISNKAQIIQEMLKASAITDIGPFASVAGCVSHLLAKKISEYLEQEGYPSDVLIENGGDLYIISSKVRIVAILDKPEQELKIGLEIQPTTGLALCASSSVIGHSLSFGNAELSLIIAENGALADSMATKTCNMLKSKNDFNTVLEYFKEIQPLGLNAIFASCDSEFLAFGDLKLVAL